MLLLSFFFSFSLSEVIEDTFIFPEDKLCTIYLDLQIKQKQNKKLKCVKNRVTLMTGGKFRNKHRNKVHFKMYQTFNCNNIFCT